MNKTNGVLVVAAAILSVAVLLLAIWFAKKKPATPASTPSTAAEAELPVKDLLFTCVKSSNPAARAEAARAIRAAGSKAVKGLVEHGLASEDEAVSKAAQDFLVSVGGKEAELACDKARWYDNRPEARAGARAVLARLSGLRATADKAEAANQKADEAKAEAQKAQTATAKLRLDTQEAYKGLSAKIATVDKKADEAKAEAQKAQEATAKLRADYECLSGQVAEVQAQCLAADAKIRQEAQAARQAAEKARAEGTAYLYAAAKQAYDQAFSSYEERRELARKLAEKEAQQKAAYQRWHQCQ